MDLGEFRASLRQAEPPPELLPAGDAASQRSELDADPVRKAILKALWHAGRDEWDAAHRIVQDIPDADASWVHAHLHRQEGDVGNANYWYRRAGKPPFAGTIASEWEALADHFLRVNSE